MVPTRPEQPAHTPLPQKIEKAERLAAIEADVRWIKAALEQNHICHQAPTLAKLEDWKKAVNAWTGLLTLFLLGTIATGFIQCESHSASTAETRTMVGVNSSNISELRDSVKEVNRARAGDTERIVREVRRLKVVLETDSSSSGPCEGLSDQQKRQLRRVLGSDDPCKRR